MFNQMHLLRLPLGGGASEPLNPEGAEKIGSGGGACPSERLTCGAASKKMRPGGGGRRLLRMTSSGSTSRDSADLSSST